MAKLFANSGDPDQTPHVAASDLGLHCLPVALVGFSSLKWIKINLSSQFLNALIVLAEMASSGKFFHAFTTRTLKKLIKATGRDT